MGGRIWQRLDRLAVSRRCNRCRTNLRVEKVRRNFRKGFKFLPAAGSGGAVRPVNY